MTGLSLFARLVCFISVIGGILSPATAHNLDTTATSISFANDFLATMSQRATVNQQLVQVGDEFWVLVKTTPGPGTNTGVGGYQTFYAPPGVEITEAAYVLPDSSDPRGFRNIPMKGQSPIAIGNGSVASATSAELVGFTLPDVNGLGLKFDPVTGAGLHRGTLAGVYADTGIFYSTDPRTAFNSYGVPVPPLVGPPSPMRNNSGDTVGEYYAANVTNSTTRKVLGVMTLWDSYQLRAYGRADVAPLLDSNGRGNAPWGLANVVAGPQSGYAWEFDAAAYDSTSGTNAQKMQAAIKVGPWNRIKYPGSQISSDQPGLVSSVLGQVGIDASLIGIDPTAIPANTKAVRFAIGQLELGRPEYSAVKVRVTVAPGDGGCQIMNADAFGGDAGGTEGGKDHMWRYFDPTVVSLNPCVFLQKVVSKSLVAPGETFYYDITFANNGTASLPNFSITDVLPTGLAHVSAVPSQSSLSGQTLTWNFGTVAPGSFITIRHYVKATGTGTLFNTATALSGSAVVGVAQTSVEVGTRSILSKSKTVTPSSVAPGGTVTYTLNIENLGTGNNGVPLRVREFLPSGFTYVSLQSATLNGATIAPPTIAVDASNTAQPLFTIGQGIQPGKKLVINFTALVGANVQPGTYFNSYQLEYEGKVIPPIPEAPVTIGGAQIGDFVWRDWNGDGVQNTGEEGIAGVTINLLLDADNNGSYETTFATTVTNANGYYLFTGFQPGRYRVVAPDPGSGGVPSGYVLTGDPDGAPATTSYDKEFALNETVSIADFGYQPAGTGTIGDQVFEDLNKSGIWNAGEPGIPNVTVNLFEDTNGNGTIDTGDLLIATQVTNGSGLYNFTNLDTTRNYIVRVDTSDSDINGYFNTEYSDPINQLISTNPRPVASGFTTASTADFGFWRALPATIGDQVFIDNNVNGIYDSGDQPLANVTVELYAADGTTLITTTSTALNGTYLFSGLSPGTYVVKVLTSDLDIPSYLTATLTQHTGVTVVAGNNDLTRDFPFTDAAYLVKSVDQARIDTPQNLTFTLRPTYPGPGLLVNAQVRDTVPFGSTFASAGQGGSNLPPVTWNLGSNTAASNNSKAVSIPASITYVGTNSHTLVGGGAVTSFTLVKPTDTIQNDFMIVILTNRRGTDINYMPPEGWTLINQTNNGTSLVISSYYKIAGASEPADYEFTFTSSRGSARIVTYRNVNTSFPINESDGQSNASSVSVTAPSITTTTANTALIRVFTAVNGNRTITSFPAPLTQVGLTNTGAGPNGLVEAFGWQDLTGSGATGASVATLSNAELNIGQSIALTPGSSASYNTTTALATNYRLATSGATVTVTMTATATGNAGTVTPPTDPTISGTNSASATKLSGPLPLSAAVNNGSATFTYTYQLTAGTIPGSVTFGGAPTDSNDTWNPGSSPSVLVSPPLTLSVNVPNSVSTSVITNIGGLYNNGSLIAESRPTQTLLNGSIGDFVWEDLNGNGIQDIGESGIGGVRVYLDSNDNGVFDPGESSATTDYLGGYRISGLLAGTYKARYDLTTIPAGYLPTTSASQSVTLAAAQQYDLADFGLRLPGSGSIGDYVWLDANNNGVQDPGETPLPGIGLTLELLIAGSWLPISSTTTAANGSYLFNGLSAGNYRVTVNTASQITSPYAQGTFALGDVMAPTYDEDGISTPHVALVTLATDSTVIDTTDFGYNWSGSIGDFVWWDYNANGIHEPGATQPELGIFNARVQLYFDADFDGVFDRILGDYEILRVFTDANGNYFIPNLPPGNYFVDVYEDSLVTDGIRNVVPTTADIVPVNLVPGNMNVVTTDFGYFVGARVEATMFWDVNGNSIRESGEALLSGITVTLTGADNFGIPVTTTAVSDANGNVVFLVPEGNYTISYDSADITANYPALGTLTTSLSFEFTALAGEDGIRRFDFGVDNTGAIGDTIFADLNTAGGVNGQPGPGDFGLPNVTVNLYLDLNGDGVIDFGAGDLLLETTLTDANGSYLFTGLPDTVGNQKYVVEVLAATIPAAYLSTASSYPTGADAINSTFSTTLINGEPILTADFGYPLGAGTFYAVSGTIYHDNGDGGGTSGNGTQNGSEPGLQNVAVIIEIDTNGDNVYDNSYFVYTDAIGFYSFGAVPQGANVRITVDQSSLPNSAYVLSGDPDGGLLSNIWNITNMQADVTLRDFGYIESLGSIAGTIVKGSGNGIAEVGEPVIADVTVTLVWFGLDGIPGTDDDVTYSTTTVANGSYQFAGLFPGGYEITTSIPGGYYAYADVDGFNPNGINVNLALGQAAVGRDFEYQSGSLSGYLWKDDNTNGIRNPGELPITGGTVFLDLNGNDVLDPVEPSTTTNADGFYEFLGLDSGTYQVRVGPLSVEPQWIPTYDFDGVSTPNGSVVVLTPNQNQEDVDFGYRDGSWAHWQLINPLGGENGPSDNPDGDQRDNLMEYALASDPQSGAGDCHLLAPSVSTPGTLDVTFTRPTGAAMSVNYILQYSDELVVNTTWTSIPLTPGNATTMNNGDGTETVTVSNIEVFTGLENGIGFIRLVVELKDNNGDVYSRSSTEVQGWTETVFGSLKCETYNIPYERCSTFTGTVSSVSVVDHTLTFQGEDLSSLLAGGVAYYAEVTAGDNEGHRFDVESFSGNVLTLATDSDLYSSTAPFNTLTGALPGTLVGDRLVIRQHWTLDQAFPPTSFNATNSHTTSDQVLIYTGSPLPDTPWNAYWLYDESDLDPATARWVSKGDATHLDQGGVVIPPGQGMFFFNRGAAAVPLLTYGEVRENLFRLPVRQGLTLMGGGYPVDQSPESRVMNNSTFFGSTKFSAADTIMIWNADSLAAGTGYTDRWLLNAAVPFKRWVKIGDNTFAPEDAKPVFKADRAAFFRAAQAVPTHSYPAPWSHLAP